MGPAVVSTPTVVTSTPTVVPAGHVVMNGKTYASMEEAVRDYHGTAGHAEYTHNGVQQTIGVPAAQASVVVQSADASVVDQSAAPLVVQPAAPLASAEEAQAQQTVEQIPEQDPKPEEEQKVRTVKPTKKGCC